MLHENRVLVLVFRVDDIQQLGLHYDLLATRNRLLAEGMQAMAEKLPDAAAAIDGMKTHYLKISEQHQSMSKFWQGIAEKGIKDDIQKISIHLDVVLPAAGGGDALAAGGAGTGTGSGDAGSLTAGAWRGSDGDRADSGERAAADITSPSAG